MSNAAANAPHEDASPSLGRILARRITGGAIGVLLLSVAANIGALGATYLFSHALGDAEFGAYAYAMSWILILATPAALGFDQLLVRETAWCAARNDWSTFAQMQLWTRRWALLASAAVAVVVALAATLFCTPQVGGPLALSTLILPVIVASRLRQATLRGAHRVVLGQSPESLVQPWALIGLSLAMVLAAPALASAKSAVWLHFAAVAAAFVMGELLMRVALPGKLEPGSTNSFQHRKLFEAAFPMLWLQGAYAAATGVDLLVAGALLGPEQAGLYAVAARLAMLASLPMTLLNGAAASTIAELDARSQRDRLQKVVALVSVAIFAVSAAAGVVMIALSPWALSWFGQDSPEGPWILAILAVGRIGYAATGPAGLLLLMCRGERTSAWIVTVGALMNLVLSLALVPFFGVIGAAIAGALAICAYQAALAVAAYRQLNVQTAACSGPALAGVWSLLRLLLAGVWRRDTPPAAASRQGVS